LLLSTIRSTTFWNRTLTVILPIVRRTHPHADTKSDRNGRKRGLEIKFCPRNVRLKSSVGRSSYLSVSINIITVYCVNVNGVQRPKSRGLVENRVAPQQTTSTRLNYNRRLLFLFAGRARAGGDWSVCIWRRRRSPRRIDDGRRLFLYALARRRRRVPTAATARNRVRRSVPSPPPPGFLKNLLARFDTCTKRISQKKKPEKKETTTSGRKRFRLRRETGCDRNSETRDFGPFRPVDHSNFLLCPPWHSCNAIICLANSNTILW